MKKWCKNNKVSIIIIVVSLIILIILGVIAEFSDCKFANKYFPNIFLNRFWEYLSAPIAALIVGIFITKQYNQKQLDIINQNRIDEASGWRKELMNIASKSIIDSDDIHRIRSSVRYLPHKDLESQINEFFKNPIDNEKSKSTMNKESFYSYLHSYIENINKTIRQDKDKPHITRETIDLHFKLMTNFIIEYCDCIDEHEQFASKFKIIDKKTNKITRLLVRYLLKHHWEYYVNLTHDKNDKDYIESMQNVCPDILNEIQKIVKPKKQSSPPAPHTN